MQHPVADEAVAVSGDDADLSQLLGDRERARDRLGRGVRAAHDLEQLHHVGRAEEMRPDHVLRALRDGRDRVDVEGRSVRREERARARDAVEAAEHVLLDVHLFEHRFDHEIDVGGRLERGSVCDPRQPRVHLVLRQLALALCRRVVAGDDPARPFDGLGLQIDEGDPNPGVGAGHRDPGPHRAAADHRRGPHRRGRSDAPVGELRGLALGEEQVQPRLGLLRAQQLDEPLALARQALREGQPQRVGDALDGPVLGQAAALFGLRPAPGRLERAVVGGCRQLADAPPRSTRQRLGVRDRGAQWVGLGNRVDQPDREGASPVDRIAAQDQLQRRLGTGQARRALGTAGPGQQAALDLGKSEPQTGRRDAVVTGQGDLQAAAHDVALERGDDRLGRRFERVDQVACARPRRCPFDRLRTGTKESPHVGTPAEHAARPGQHQRLDGGIGLGRLERRDQRLDRAWAERVYGRVVDREDRNAVTGSHRQFRFPTVRAGAGVFVRIAGWPWYPTNPCFSSGAP